MVPGTDPAGVSVTVRNGPIGPPVSAAMVDGGFDPIAIAANPGDTLRIIVQRAGGAASAGYAVVPARTRPAVVRTSPPKGKTDVVLNSRITVIFSQPMDRASLPSALHLRLAGTEVAGTVTVGTGGEEMLGAEFAPADLLTPLTTYQFEVSTAALGENGQPLAAPVQVDFTTGSDAAAVATVRITPSPLQLVVGGQQQMSALPVSAGTPLTTSCAWSASDAAVAAISSTGLVSALSVGTALIQAICGGISAEDTVTVVPVPSGLVFASVSTGYWFTCGLTTGGAAYCWGRNEEGGLGDGTTVNSLTPVAVGGGLTFAALSVGLLYACGVTPVGAVYCWGRNFEGELGTYTGQICNGSECSTIPYALSGGLTFATVSAGETHVCGVTTAGVAYCWGPGVGAVAGGLTFSAVSAGSAYQGTTCGVTTTGAAYCWGDNRWGELGTGSTTGPEQCFDHSVLPPQYYGCSRVPVAVAGGLRFGQVDISPNFACGLTSSGVAYCWGDNSYGQLGDGSTSGPEMCYVYDVYGSGSWPCSSAPVAVAGRLTFAALSAEGGHACGLTMSGAAYCWGDNSFGELGDGTATTSVTPVAVGGNLTFATVSAGGAGNTCGVTTTGVAYCWGDNSYGQLGDGTQTGSLVPVKVAYQP
jgi:alpha-tubulin suppressor-like RCC1 family protein